ncbi:type VI secretion system baseplate subunit TssK [Caulobacter sp. CCUG 60055]|uniref:type VI secretion system baseplate subunit TssK n=1 Tax=Caulobacter sp. CCUG 60055 TaxID=2100090 RepID=UPI001FA81881|nr:type VI secretion system baseplate subunit TssK [Caulobacter sp. CCUG 60055]MBQ1542666.1 type VI secretion system baseplate subunit TssK [Caulobacteraceae bacterium]MCI3179469.1 type VI secretion system baseplate subunit TssK [Caulobacter sp. CCUG 60055]
MQSDSRVAWREGLFLRQQHFQQQDRYLEALVSARANTLRPYPWGVSELKLNADLAALGKFGVEQMVGVLPDGLPFSIPGDLPPPPPLDVPADARDVVIYLTLPARQAGAVEFKSRAERGAGTVRYLVDEEDVADAFSDERGQEPIEVARPNLSFGVTQDQTYGRVLLGLARIREVHNGALVFDERYIPPCLDIRASRRLTGFLTDIIGRAAQRVDELALRAVEATDGGAETFASFLLLQALNRWVSQLRHLAALPAVHPERLYETFVGMAGELCTLTRPDRRPPPFPDYVHERLQPTFEPVFEVLQASLSAVFDRSAMQMPLQMAGPGAYTSRITDHNLYKTGYFYLAVNARASLDDIRGRFPAVAKIGAVQKMREIVDSALPGVPLRHTPTPPPQLRVIPGYVYFELDRSAPDWRDFANAAALGLHVAGEWPELKLELWCVKGNGR